MTKSKHLISRKGIGRTKNAIETDHLGPGTRVYTLIKRATFDRLNAEAQCRYTTRSEVLRELIEREFGND